jgi:hypothetical protein
MPRLMTTANQLYPETAFASYLIRITISDRTIEKVRPHLTTAYGLYRAGVYTIVDEQDGWGLLKAYAQNRNGCDQAVLHNEL